MRLSRVFFVLALGSMASLATAANAANIVANPTFNGAPTSYYGDIPGWTSPHTFMYGGDPGNQGSGSAAGTPFDSPGLPPGANNAGFLQTYTGGGGPNTNTLSQDLTTVVGDLYSFSFLESARNCCGGTAALTATITGVTTDFTETSTPSPSGFSLISGSFIASSTTEDLVFSSSLTSGSDATVLITDVSVAAAPEPSSLVLLGTGLVGLAGAARRKMRKS